jgi:hypothetical protein
VNDVPGIVAEKACRGEEKCLLTTGGFDGNPFPSISLNAKAALPNKYGTYESRRGPGTDYRPQRSSRNRFNTSRGVPLGRGGVRDSSRDCSPICSSVKRLNKLLLTPSCRHARAGVAPIRAHLLSR